MKINFSSILKLTLSLGFGVFLIWYFYDSLTEEEKAQIFTSLKSANYWYVGISIFAGLSSHFSRAMRWRMLLTPLGHTPKKSNTFFSVMIMYIANLAFPRLGEVMRCGILKRYEKVPMEEGIGTMLTERLVDTITLLFVAMLTVVLQYDVFMQVINEQLMPLIGAKTQSTADLLLKLVIFGAIAASVFFSVRLYLRRTGKKIALLEKLKPILMGFADGLKSIKDLKNVPAFIGHSIYIWAMYWAMIYIVFNALPETSSLGPLPALTCLFFGSFAIILVQGGLGAYPAIIASVLLLYGIDQPVGYAFGWIVWTGQTIMIMTFGLMSVALLPILNQGADDTAQSS